MSEHRPEIIKHVKQLENQNNKLRKLLGTALEVADKDYCSFTRLKLESEVLAGEMNELQMEKHQLEDTIAAVISEGSDNIDHTIYNLEKEHVELRSKLEEVLNEIRKGDLEINQLKSEDAELKKTIAKLEDEKSVLLGQLKSEIGCKLNATSSLGQKQELKEEHIKRQPKFIKSVGGPISLVDMIKDKLYVELQDTISKSSEEINQIKGSLSDPDITNLIQEIETQKKILLNNLKLLKLKEEKDSTPDEPTTNSNTNLPPLQKSSEIETAAVDLGPTEENSAEKPSTSFDQSKLDELVSKLENERTFLLKRLHSISETSAQQFEERHLQTQSELHSTFMREVSSEEITDGLNKRYDDATNQMYADEEARLEQRIRELEAENDRIKKELDALTNQIRGETVIVPQNIISIQLKEKIAEMENNESILMPKQ